MSNRTAGNNISQARKRNDGLDLLRILSMLMSVCLHSNSHGGLTVIPETGMDANSISLGFCRR